jgi:hypothetical protein
VSFFEIYNEKVRDLLPIPERSMVFTADRPKAGLRVREPY